MTYTEHTTTRRDFVVPAPPPNGATSEDMAAAWTAAEQAYREMRRLPLEVPLPLDALTFRPMPQAIVIGFVMERTGTVDHPTGQTQIPAFQRVEPVEPTDRPEYMTGSAQLADGGSGGL